MTLGVTAIGDIVFQVRTKGTLFFLHNSQTSREVLCVDRNPLILPKQITSKFSLFFGWVKKNACLRLTITLCCSIKSLWQQWLSHRQQKMSSREKGVSIDVYRLCVPSRQRNHWSLCGTAGFSSGLCIYIHCMLKPINAIPPSMSNSTKLFDRFLFLLIGSSSVIMR